MLLEGATSPNCSVETRAHTCHTSRTPSLMKETCVSWYAGTGRDWLTSFVGAPQLHRLDTHLRVAAFGTRLIHLSMFTHRQEADLRLRSTARLT
jgi:hypothetical protein